MTHPNGQIDQATLASEIANKLQAEREQQAPIPPARMQISETRVNAMLMTIQTQRDHALNQWVMVSADLAMVREDLEIKRRECAQLEQRLLSLALLEHPEAPPPDVGMTEPAPVEH